LEKAEEFEVGLSEEANTLKKVGIEFLSYPIEDRHLPQVNDFKKLIESIYLQLLNGVNIAVHCRAGIGRTGITSACILIKDGYESEIAMDMVAAARGTQIPDTQEQYDFICDYVPSKK
jgi:protein-tyrosine phosphatase